MSHHVPNLQIVEDLKSASARAFKAGHLVESSIILFQIVETLLRITLDLLGRRRGVSAKNLATCANTEQSFSRLVLYLDLIEPKTGLGEELVDLNRRRNKIAHRLFYDFDSQKALQQELQAFCLKAIELNEALRKLIGVV